MAKTKDLTGQRFGRLVVLYDTGKRKHRKIIWHCKCDCGNEVNVTGGHLTSGSTKSCGCYRRERAAEVHAVHGMSRQGERHSAYKTWCNMIQRCENPNDKYYKDYGGRGITVCDDWHNAAVFIDWALANGWREGLTLDRIDSNGNYEPDNCRWATWKEQQRNRRNNRLITFNGKTQPMAQWAEELNISYQALAKRINMCHWPIERALTEPVRRTEHG